MNLNVINIFFVTVCLGRFVRQTFPFAKTEQKKKQRSSDYTVIINDGGSSALHNYFPFMSVCVYG